MIQIAGDPDFQHYLTLLAQYPKEVQDEIGYPEKPDVEVAFAVVWDDKPYAWASLKKTEMANGLERYILFAPMLISSNYEITQLMENKIREEAQKRGVKELLHIGLMPQVAKSFGFKPTTYNDLKDQLDFCLECKRREKTHCQPMIMKL